MGRGVFVDRYSSVKTTSVDPPTEIYRSPVPITTCRTSRVLSGAVFLSRTGFTVVQSVTSSSGPPGLSIQFVGSPSGPLLVLFVTKTKVPRISDHKHDVCHSLCL